MKVDAPDVSRERHILGYVGAVLLLLIIPVKLLRYSSAAGSVAVGVAPSLLGPSGLLFLLLSSRGRLSRLTVGRTAILVGAISKLLPIPESIWKKIIFKRVPKGTEEINLRAFQAGKLSG